jgi:hypothetical protein
VTGTRIDVRDLAWLAGIFDMKASLIRKKNRSRSTPQIVLYVESKNHTVVRTIARMTGTSPEMQPAKGPTDWVRKGCVQHCPDAHVHVGDFQWGMPAITRWTITGAAAAVVLHNVMPYMRTDAGLSEALTEIFNQAVTTGQGWGATRGALRRLRDLGWALPEQFQDLDIDQRALPAAQGHE